MSTSTTPPPLSPDSSLVPPDTPRHHRDSTANQYDLKFDESDSTFTSLADDMGPFFLGPIPAQAFLESFMPPPSAGARQFVTGMFEPFIKKLPEHEYKWYNVFVSSDSCRPPHVHLFLCLILPFQIDTINPHLKNLVVIKTSHASGQPSNSRFSLDLQPDCSVYTTDYVKPETPSFDFNHVDFIIEFKKKPDDPFVDDPSETSSNRNPFLCPEGPTRKVLGQLTAYATAILSAQYRTHLFMVFIVGEYARLIRWDRGGAVVTKPIRFNEEPHLFDFLMRYDIASHEDRGHDSTVSVPSKVEIEQAKSIVSEWDKTEALLTVTVPHKDTERRFIIPRPDALPFVPVRRWTRSSIAYDIQTKQRVYLKDSWRVLMEGIEPEGVIYRRFHENGVPNIPPCLSAGDIGDVTHHQTRTHDKVTDIQGPHSYWNLTPHRHYRIVLGVVGRKLEKFTSSREFVKAMHAALKGA